MSVSPWTAFDRRWNSSTETSNEAPIVLLAAGWRSGSTLLQRLLCSTGEACLWGEPYGRADLLPSLTRSASVLSESWPTAGHYPADDVFGDLSSHWIANVYPPAEALVGGYRALLDKLFVEPAKARGFARWGLKEVRLDANDARFLEWMYPKARFVFLVRDPWSAWSSAKGMTWYERWPDRPVEDAETFARHWDRLTRSFLDWPQENAILVRYEDVREPSADLSILAQHCGLEPLQHEVKSQVRRGIQKPRQPLEPGEIAVIDRIAGEAARALGYVPPTATLARSA